MPRRPPRLATPRPSGGTRYPTAHRQARTQAIARAQRCENPNGCPHPDQGKTTNPLTLDHPHPRSRGGRETTPTDPVLCRRCNTTKHATIARTPDTT